MTSEAARLREIVQEREDTIRAISDMAEEGRDSVRETAAAHILTDIMRKAEEALDEGGDDNG
jgi:hypothetical protein